VTRLKNATVAALQNLAVCILVALIVAALGLLLPPQPVRADGKTQIVVDYSSPIFDIIKDSQAKLGMTFNQVNYRQPVLNSYYNPLNWEGTQTVAHAPPTINYNAYRAWEQTAGQWAKQYGADPNSGWSWVGNNGYVSFFAKAWDVVKATGGNVCALVAQTNVLNRTYGPMMGTQTDVNN